MIFVIYYNLHYFRSKYKQPQLRPKGLGLGADKMVKDNQNKKGAKDKDEELSIVKNSYVKITSGKHSGYYGKVYNFTIYTVFTAPCQVACMYACRF